MFIIIGIMVGILLIMLILTYIIKNLLIGSNKPVKVWTTDSDIENVMIK